MSNINTRHKTHTHLLQKIFLKYLSIYVSPNSANVISSKMHFGPFFPESATYKQWARSVKHLKKTQILLHVLNIYQKLF